MTWTCSECLQKFQPNEKKYKFNLCHICYFNPAIAKLYRTGEKWPLPDSPPALVEGAPAPGVIGVDDGLMLVTQREMDDDTFQLKIREAVQEASVRDKKAVGDAVKALPPGRKPDISAIATDIFSLKTMLLKLLVANKVPLPPDLEKSLLPPPPADSVRQIQKHLNFAKNYGHDTVEISEELADKLKKMGNPCGEIPLGPPQVDVLSAERAKKLRRWAAWIEATQGWYAQLHEIRLTNFGIRSDMTKMAVIEKLVSLEELGFAGFFEDKPCRFRSDSFKRRIIPPLNIDHSIELDRAVETNIPVRVMNIAEAYKLSNDKEVMLKQMTALPRDEQLYLCGYLRLPFPLPVAPLATGSSNPYPESLQTAWRGPEGPGAVLSSKQLDSLLAVNADELCDGK